MFRRPARSGGDALDPADPRRVVPARPNTQLAARVGLWGLVALGAIGGCVGLVRPTEQGVAATGTEDDDAVPVEVAGFAEVAVTEWIEATPDDEEALHALFAEDPSSSPGDVGVRRAGATNVVGARALDDDYWAVTVAVPVDERADEGEWSSAGTWYVEVGVQSVDGVATAVSEPALVSAPAEPEPLPDPGGMGVPSRDDAELEETVQGFLSALVAGSGDVSRYSSPDVDITAVTPAPFAEVALQRWDVTELDDGSVRVRVQARGTSAAGVPRTVTYEIGLAENGGRWEVTSVSGAPTLADDDRSAGGADGDATSTTTAVATTASISSGPGA